MSNIDSFKAGQKLVCTITKLPQAAADGKTIARLMRLDHENKKALRHAQKVRGQRILIYNRGNRDWVSREKCAKVVHVAVGQEWTIAFTLDMAHDLKKVAGLISIKTA